MYADKTALINFFRDAASRNLQEIQRVSADYKEQAKRINAVIRIEKDKTIEQMLQYAEANQLGNGEVLNYVLYITYASYVVMLEFRNKVWPYEYMAFARRIGELWEPFCKEAFYYSVKPLTITEPPVFDDVQRTMKQSAADYIDSLAVDSQTKRMLLYHYNIPWNLVDSGGIQLGLDLHFEQNGIRYNCDFKSGFSSNEKGNTNRLLLVASIYRCLGQTEKTILFVRQNEDENNHYLQTLKNSGLWEVFCAEDVYAKIYEFTGFHLRSWLDSNAVWENDIDDQLRRHLKAEGLIKYLTW